MAENCIKIAFYYLVQGLTLLVLGIPILLVHLLMRLRIVIQRIKLQSTSNEGGVGQFHGGKMCEIENLTTTEKKDFKKHRSSSYATQLTFGSLWELSKLMGNRQMVPLADSNVLYEVIMKTVCCHYLVKGEKDSDVLWKFPIEVDDYNLFKGFYWDIREIIIHKNKEISIVDRIGEVHTKASPTWKLAIAHAQTLLTFFAPGLAHNHVHFVFPSLMAFYIRDVLPETSILRQLVEPHTRFTQYINYQALHVCQSSSNTRSFIDRVFRPWLSFPIDNEDFLKGIQQNCEKFYYDDLTLLPELNQELPYHKFLKSYYDVFHGFVQQLQPLIEDDYAKLLRKVMEHLPAVKHPQPVDVIATLLWNCAVVHCCDHMSYLKLFAYEYGCMAMRIPLVRDSDGEIGLGDNKHSGGENSPLFAQQDVYRSRCFMRTFVQYNPGSGLDMTLKRTQYNFTDSSALKAAEEFSDQLHILDESLRDKHEDIIPLEEMIRTVCF